jgi:hypothetical protein
MAPGQMLEVKDAIRRTHLDEARQLASIALELGSTAEVEALVNEHPRAPSGRAATDSPTGFLPFAATPET